MPLLFRFKIFRSKENKDFDENVARSNGYTLNRYRKFIQKIIFSIAPNQFSNLILVFATKK